MGIENPVHLLFLGAVALLVLGPKRLPDMAKALGNGIREFRESISAGEDDDDAPVSPNGAPPAATPPPAPPNATPPPAPPPPAAPAPAAPSAATDSSAQDPPAAGGAAGAPGEEPP